MKDHFPVSNDARVFLEGLLEEAGMSIVPPEVREKMLADLAKRLDAKLTLAAVSVLPDKKVRIFEDLLANRISTAEITRFLSKHVPNIAQVYAQALVEFRKNYLVR